MPQVPNILPFMSDEQMQRVHEASIHLLSTTGFRFMHKESLEIFKKHGFKVDNEIVYFTKESIEKALKSVSNQFTLKARDPKYDIEFTMDTFSCGMGGSAVYIVDPDGKRRSVTMDDAINVMKICQMTPEVETYRHLLIPTDISGTLNPPWLTAQMVKYVDKPFHYMSSDELDIVRMGYGVTRETMVKDAEKKISYGQSSINVISPLTLSTEQCRHMIEFLRHGIAFNIAPMPSGGSTAPITLEGEIILQNCENLAPLVLTQLVSPGHPILYGTIGSHTDMRTMATIFGSPETRILEYAAGQMARFYNMLSRGDVGLTDAPGPDFQAGAESMFQFVNIARSGINFNPGMGHLGSFMGGSLAKVVMDADIVASIQRYKRPLDFTQDSMALDIIEKVGPGGHFVTQAHTLKHCRSEYIIPQAFTRDSYDAWEKAGSPTAMDRAHALAEKRIAAYEAPDLAPGFEKDLAHYMEKTYGL